MMGGDEIRTGHIYVSTAASHGPQGLVVKFFMSWYWAIGQVTKIASSHFDYLIFISSFICPIPHSLKRQTHFFHDSSFYFYIGVMPAFVFIIQTDASGKSYFSVHDKRAPVIAEIP